ncbi:MULTISPECIES: hypothetical protein [Idiomarina]|uniref:hypothetical protein n=1 Tax=Idiomarina TaxID=135575 RepID=UPI00257B0DA4|nr:hypothetical protein [Idiomarina sp. T82-3]
MTVNKLKSFHHDRRVLRAPGAVFDVAPKARHTGWRRYRTPAHGTVFDVAPKARRTSG